MKSFLCTFVVFSIVCSIVFGACTSDLQVTASYTTNAVANSDNMVLTFTVTDTTGNPGSGIGTLNAAIAIASGCNFGTPTVSAGCGSYSGTTWNLNNVFGNGGGPPAPPISCTLTFTASPATSEDCPASITLQNNPCSNAQNSASTVVSPRSYEGVAMQDEIFVYYRTPIQWTTKNLQPGETWSIYLQVRTSAGTWTTFPSSRYPVDPGKNRNILVQQLPQNTKSYVWGPISNILPTETLTYRVIIESNVPTAAGTPTTVYFFNGGDQFKIRVKPLRNHK